MEVERHSNKKQPLRKKKIQPPKFPVPQMSFWGDIFFVKTADFFWRVFFCLMFEWCMLLGVSRAVWINSWHVFASILRITVYVSGP